MTNELESDIRYFKACIEYMPKGEPIASYVIHKGICERAIVALEKQIPKEPFETYDDDTCLYKHFECPECGDRLSRHAVNSYCMKCGQLIKWVKEGGEYDNTRVNRKAWNRV